MPNPAWFNEDYYAEQKVAQMNATGYEMGEGGWLAANGGGATEWTVDLYNQYLAYYSETFQPVTSYDNFVACNGKDYGPGVTLADINVSPNQYFNVNEYLQALADYNNANPDAYEGAVPEGGWNVANELDTIFSYGSSVWEHYNANWDSLRINPSNSFDTSAYLEARAQAMGNGATVEDAIAAIKDAGLNPIQDWYDFGQANNIPATAVAAAVNPVLPEGGWTVWGDESVTPVPPDDGEEPDPFEQNVTHENIEAGQTVYPAEGETYSGNTQFDAAWIPSSAGSTLNAKDEITGPENGDYNTLSVTLGKNWNGFNGVKQEDGSLAPSVNNIGRVELIHNPANNEASYTFDAKNISGAAYRYDLVGYDGPGSISLKNLSDAVEQVRITNLVPADAGKNDGRISATNISFAEGANKSRTDELTLVVENVGADGNGAAPITSGNFGIEALTVQAMKGDSDSYIDLSNLAGIKTLNFTGAGNIKVTEVASGINTYDASAATGVVNMAVNTPRGSTVVKGGSGLDTVTVTTQATWKPLGLENVERLAIANDATINLVNVGAGLTDLYVEKNGGTVKNLTADNFTVHLAELDQSEDVTVNGDKAGSLQNLTWEVSNGIVNTLETNAAATVTLNVDEEARGSVNVTNFKADSATALVVNSPNNVAFNGGSLKSVQDLTLNLEGNGSTTVSINLPDAQNVTVNADGQSVILANLGDNRNDSAINLDVNGANDFTVGDITTTLGCTIDVNIEAENIVTLGNIDNSTNLLSGGKGDLSVVVSADNVSLEDPAGVNDGVTFKSGPMSINFSDVTGDVGTAALGVNPAEELKLDSQGTINYIGAAGDDNVVVEHVEEGSSSSYFELGGGANSLAFSDSVVKNARTQTEVTVNVEEGDSTVNIVNLANAASNAKLFINMEGFGNGDSISGADVNTVSVGAGVGQVAAGDRIEGFARAQLVGILGGFGIDVAVNESITAGAKSGMFVYDNNVYASTDNGGSVLVCLGSVDDGAGQGNVSV